MSNDNSALSGPESALRDRTALVLGADNYLGSESSRRLALEGCRVIGLGTDERKLAKLGRDVADVSGTFAFFAGDLRDRDWARRTLHHTFDQHAGINVLINLVNGEAPGASRSFFQAFGEFRPAIQLERLIDCVGEDAGATAGSRLPLSPTMAYTRLWLENAALAAHAHLIAAEIVNLAASPAPGDVDVRVSVRHGEVIAVRRQLTGASESHPLGPAPSTMLSETDRGLGVLAGRDFLRGELIVKTTGVVIDHQTEHSMQIGWGQHFEVDAPVRYLNHSCQPNAGVRTSRAGFPDLVAFRDIRAGEEITLDYAMTEFKHYPRANPALEFSLACHCGSPRCRGRLGYYSELPDDVKREYAGFVSDYLTRPRPGR